MTMWHRRQEKKVIETERTDCQFVFARVCVCLVYGFIQSTLRLLPITWATRSHKSSLFSLKFVSLFSLFLSLRCLSRTLPYYAFVCASSLSSVCFYPSFCVPCSVLSSLIPKYISYKVCRMSDAHLMIHKIDGKNYIYL